MDLVKNNIIIKSKSKTKSKTKSISKSKSKSKSKLVSKCGPKRNNSSNKNGTANVETLIKSHIKPSVEPYVFYDNFIDNNQKIHFQKPIGIYDPHGENINPLTGMEYQNLYINERGIKYDSGPAEGYEVPNTYRNWSYIWTNLPLYSKVTSIVESIRNNNMTIIKAGTGTGKSFLAGRICSQAFNFQKKVLMTLPKKILAREAAKTTGMSCDVVVGEEVGYKFKGAHEVNKNGKDTKIIFTTTGTLVRQITGEDPLLKDYSCIIVDEAHERSVQTDQIILFLKKALVQRPDLKVVFISATLDTQLFMDYFKDYTCNIVELPEQIATFPIKDIYEKKIPEDWQKTAIEKVMSILRSGECGDILVFIKSGADAAKMRSYLEPQLKTLPLNNATGLPENPFMITLDAGVTKEEQEYATKEFDYLNHPDANPEKPYTRKIVFSTNVAESSLTVKGAVFVVDCGLALEDLYEPKRDANALLEKFVSQSAVKQRRGRVGRTKPGICYHLYSEGDLKKFSEYPIPSIQKSDLTMDLLDIMKIEYVKNIGDLKQLLSAMISPPSQIFIDSALHNLYLNGAITSKENDGTLTTLGRAYSSFSGLTLQMARSIIASYYYHCKYDVIAIMVIVADLGGRMDGLYAKFKPRFKMNESEYGKAMKEHEKKQHRFDSSSGDFITIHNIYQEFREFMKIPKNVQVPNDYEVTTFGGDALQKVTNVNVNANLLKNNANKNNNNVPPQIPIEQLTRKTSADARKWCLENGISHRYFVDSKNKLSWDKVGNEVRKIEFALMKIVQPPELRKAHFNKYKEEGGIGSKKDLDREIAESKKSANVIEDRDANEVGDDTEEPVVKSILNRTVEGGYRRKKTKVKYEGVQLLTHHNRSRENYIETNNSPNSSVENPQNKSALDLTAYGGALQYGGYNAKPFEVNYFPNSTLFEKREDNILAAIGHGFYTHMVKHVNKNFYTTCVPLEPVMCYPDMNSSISLKAKPKYLVYYELFMLRENQPTLKLNVVNKLPTKVQAELKSMYGKLIENCYKTIKRKDEYKGKSKSKKGKHTFKKFKFQKKKKFYKKW